MANTFITNTSKFKPFSFQEMLQPYAIYTDAYNKADEELNTLLEDAATKGFNFAPQDTVEAAAYNTIIDRIKTASDQLADGLNPQLSKEINQLNKDYRKVMLPIQQQLNKRAELAAEQRELLAKNPNLRFTKDYSTESLKNITGSSTYNIIDLDDLYKTTAQEFSSKTSTLYRDNITPTPIEGTDYYNVTTGYGYTPEEFVEGLSNKNSDIYKFYKKKADAIDSRTDISNSIKEEMKAAVLKGMEASSGTFKTSPVKGTVDTDNSSLENKPMTLLNKDTEGNEYYLQGTNVWKKDTSGVWNKQGTSSDDPDNPSNPSNPSNSSSGKVVLKPNQKLIGKSVFTDINRGNTYANFRTFKKEMKEKFGNRTVSQIPISNLPVKGVAIYYDDFDPTHPMARWIERYAGKDAVNEYTFYYDLDDGDIFAIQGKQVKPTKVSTANETPSSSSQNPTETPTEPDVDTEANNDNVGLK
jgi:hypothetical protein